MKRRPSPPAVEKDPIVLYGDRYSVFRVQFWEYFTIALLRAFARIAEDGGFGSINAFHGEGRTRDGASYTFSWQKSGALDVSPIAPVAAAGHVILEGDLDYETINRIRNFQIFHLRADAGYVMDLENR